MVIRSSQKTVNNYSYPVNQFFFEGNPWHALNCGIYGAPNFRASKCWKIFSERFVNTRQKINVFIKLSGIVRVYGFQFCKRIVQNWWKIIVM